jgi:hypothetical protein
MFNADHKKSQAKAADPKKLSWADLAKPGCRKCHGLGTIGKSAKTSKPVACDCAIKNFIKVRRHIEQKIAMGQLATMTTKVKTPWWRRIFRRKSDVKA